MAITKIQSGAIPADAIDTTHIGDVGADKITGQVVSSQISDLNVTHAKLHTTMDLSSKTVTLPTLSTLNITGNVGIGTSSPARQLSIVDDGTNGQAIMEVIDSTNNNVAGIFLGRANNTNIGGMRYFHSTNHLALRSNDEDALIIDSSGNVGIGTETPAQLLEVSGNGKKSRFTRSGSAGTLVEYYYGSNPAGGIQVQSTGLGIGGAARENDLFIKTDGKVGIGTTSPSEKLHISTGNLRVDTSSSSSFKIQNAGTNAIGLYAASGDELYVGGNNSYALRFLNDGSNNVVFDNNSNVGIGTASPAAKLHVEGTIYADNGTTVKSVTTVGTGVGGVPRQRFHRLINQGAGQQKVLLMRYGRHWWGVGWFEIIIRGTYYGGNSKYGVFTVNGHTRSGLASIASHINNSGTAVPFAENYNSTHESCDISINLPGYEYYNIEYNIQHSYQQSAANDVGIHVGNSNAFFLYGTVEEFI